MIRRLLRLAALLLLLLCSAAAWLLFDGNRQLSTPLVLDQPRAVQIASGQRVRDVIESLRTKGWLASDRQGLYLEVYARATDKAGAIKAGEYLLEPGLTAYQVLELWLSGRVHVYELRVVEGTRFEDALRLIQAHPQIRQTLNTHDPAAVMAAIGYPGQHPEGRFFPDTYVFPRDTPDITILRRGLDAMTRALDTEWKTRAADLPYATADEALVMASIVEKETGLAIERPEIAGVFVRRLRLGMRLQTDPTVIYGLGALFDGNLRKRDLLAANPYNTYLNSGLPPSPICLPGRAAIHAALHPADGKTLFFVSRGDGSHQFSETLEAHEDAVRRFQLRGGNP